MEANSGGPKDVVIKPVLFRQDSGEHRGTASGSFSLKMLWESEKSDLSGSHTLGQRLSRDKNLFKMGTSIFLDASEMKAKVRESLVQPTYNVTDYYFDTGCWQMMARSALFEKVTLLVTAMNAIWIWIDTDLNQSEVLFKAPIVFQIVEHCFTFFFTSELIIRMCAFRRKRDGLKDKWIVFDLLLVSFMVIETWILTIILFIASSRSGTSWLSNTSILRMARMLRLSRMARMAKLLKAMPELMILIKGMMAAMRSVFFTLCLLVVIMYVFAIAFTQLTPGYFMHGHFETVMGSMYTLLVRGALTDNASILLAEVKAESVALAVLFIIFILLSALTVLNMLIGVLVHVVSSVAAVEREEQLLAFVKVKMQNVVNMIDTDGSGEISRNEFAAIVLNAEAIKCLLEIGVDPVGLVDQTDYIFTDPMSGEERADLTFSEFMEVVLELRGKNAATVKDIIDMRKFMLQMFNRMEQKLERRLVRSLTQSSLQSRHSVRQKSCLRPPKRDKDSDDVVVQTPLESRDPRISDRHSVMSEQSVLAESPKATVFHETNTSSKLFESEGTIKKFFESEGTTSKEIETMDELRDAAGKLQPSINEISAFVTELEASLDSKLKELQRILETLDANGGRDEFTDTIHRLVRDPAEHQLTSRLATPGASRSGASLGLKARFKDDQSTESEPLGRCSRLLTSLSHELNELHSIRPPLCFQVGDTNQNAIAPPTKEGGVQRAPQKLTFGSETSTIV